MKAEDRVPGRATSHAGGYGDIDESSRYRYPDERKRAIDGALAGYTDDEAARPRFRRGTGSSPGASVQRRATSVRSDETIRKDICKGLSDVDARKVQVSVQQAHVTLSGSVAEQRLKRLAQNVAEQCRGVREVQNQIRVSRASARGA